MTSDEDHAVLGQYEVFRESVDFSRIESVTAWLHHVPEDQEAVCGLTALVALPLRQGGVVFGLDGSGITTKAVIGGLYARAWPAAIDPDVTPSAG